MQWYANIAIIAYHCISDRRIAPVSCKQILFEQLFKWISEWKQFVWQILREVRVPLQLQVGVRKLYYWFAMPLDVQVMVFWCGARNGLDPGLNQFKASNVPHHTLLSQDVSSFWSKKKRCFYTKPSKLPRSFRPITRAATWAARTLVAWLCHNLWCSPTTVNLVN